MRREKFDTVADAFCGYGYEVHEKFYSRLTSHLRDWHSATFRPPGDYVPSLVERCLETVLINADAIPAKCLEEALGHPELSPFRHILSTGDYHALMGRQQSYDEPRKKEAKSCGAVSDSHEGRKVPVVVFTLRELLT
jgi:hypothetical protein